MSGKQISGLVATIFGVILLIFSIYTKVRISSIKDNVSQETQLFPGDIIGKTIDTTIQSQLHKYDIASSWGLGVGIGLVVIGAGCLVFCRKK